MKSNRGKSFISVVVPIYNEQETLLELTNRLVLVLDRYSSYELIYVNDGSTDSSEHLIENLCLENTSIKLISFSRNFGHQPAISAGINYAGGDVVVIMDGDLQDPPEILPEFIEKWREGYDVVYAIRKNRKENFLKRSAYFIFYRLLRTISETEIPLDSGDFSAIDRVVADRFNEMPEYNRFIRGMRAWIGYRQVGIEYERQVRIHGRPKFTLRKLLRLAYDGLISFSKKPLIFATQLGMGITLLSFAMIGYALWQKIFIGAEPKGWTSIIIVVLFLGGMQLLILGILGEYIGRIFDETKGRPNYIVWKTKNIDQSEVSHRSSL